MERIRNALKNNGTFLFSTHHPVSWGAETNRSKEKYSSLLGYEKYKDGKCEVFGSYLNTKKINDIMFNEFNAIDFPDIKVTYYHRPLSNIIGDILKSGFMITDFIEPKPLKSVIKNSCPGFYKGYSKIPIFMIFELKKL
ncbi:MAG: hypothetical protein US76_00675 [Parcubacteria group bacterium GW2011_GWA2_38_13b]|nr:MAG: hypothetical protein US76_00675 [Parcubacteria group bacterium GW2011_GWA2_38_13b]